MTPQLPELPFIPESNELRIRLVAWGRQCYEAGVFAQWQRMTNRFPLPPDRSAWSAAKSSEQPK